MDIKTLHSKLNELSSVNSSLEKVCKPQILDLNFGVDTEIMSKILCDKAPAVFDTLHIQIGEWIKVKNPSRKFSNQELEQQIEQELKSFQGQDYGVWVYYPWSNRMIHLLREEKFVEVRTSRNRNKITAEEQAILQKKKIAVIGLSVGQSVAYTLAQERICGELRLADYDTLELNNLNRIRSGLHHLGLLKVVGIARDISEIDPFLKVSCFPEGIHEANINSFFSDDGKVDLLIEESDSFDIKIISRFKARELGIPVLMEASDRCMVDVERFDHEPLRPILHGLVEHLSPASLKQLKTTEDKIPPMLDVLGLDSTSVRLRASMVEIEQTINTWPQLASAVTMGGGITADVARRILLGLFNDSGRYYVDIEELIGPAPDRSEPTPETKPYFSKQNFRFPTPEKWRNENTAPSDGVIRDLVKHAIMAPSAGNLQPWYWVNDSGVLQLWHDVPRSDSWSDPGHRLAEMGLGAALENLCLCARQKYSLETHVVIAPPGSPNHLKAFIRFSPAEGSASEQEKILFQAIPMRCSNRKKGQRKLLAGDAGKFLQNACPDGFKLSFVQDENALEVLGQSIAEVERYRFLHEQGHADFFGKEMRWTPEEIKASADGLDVATLELSVLDFTGMKVLRDPKVARTVSAWNGGRALTRITSSLVKNSSALVLLCGDSSFEPMQRGQALQRVWLAAHSLSLSFHPVSSPVFFHERLKKENDLHGLFRSTVEQSYEHIKNYFTLKSEDEPMFLFRLSYSDEPTARALRRDIDSCFHAIEPKI